MSGYRDKGKARSPALEKLAEEARATAAAPAQTSMLSEAEVLRRLELAVDVHQDREGCLSAMAFVLGLFAFLGLMLAASHADELDGSSAFLLVLLVVATIACAWGASTARRNSGARRAKAIETELAWATSQPFPVTGYRDWLVNDKPVLIVHLRDPIERATFVDAVRAIDPAIEAEATGDKTFRLEIPARVLTGEHPARYGNAPLLHTVMDKLLRPLHDDVGIERIDMGGTIQDRA